MKILIVEDDPIASAVLEGSLRQLGHEIELAGDGALGWRQFQKGPHRIVISDWVMPGLNGLELCQRIRQAGGEYTYFILLSNLSTSGGKLDDMMEAGVDDFLPKPVVPPELKARLHVAQRILNYATQVRQLQEIIPVCGYCKKIRDDQNYWSQLEEYLRRQAGSSVSHGICPDCYERVVVPQMRRIGAEPPPYPGARSSPRKPD